MTRGRTVAGVVLVLVLVLAAPTAASALWSARGAASGSVAAGRVQFASAGFEALAAKFGSTEASRVITRPVTVSNTGTVPAGFTLRLGAESANDLARVTTVTVWPVARDGDCVTGAGVPAGATVASWAAVPALTGSLPPSAVAVYCVRTSVSAADVAALPGTSTVVTLRLTAAVNAWTHETAVRAVQSAPPAGGGSTVSPMPAPIEPTSGESSPTTIAASAASVSAEPAGPASPSTPAPGDYTIASAGTTWCATGAQGAPGGSAPALVLRQCDGSADQTWHLAAEEDGYRRIGSSSEPSRTWTAAGTGVRLEPISGEAAQQWAARSRADGSVTLVSRLTGACLTAPSAPAGEDPSGSLAPAACDGSAAQAFSLVTRS
jgi:Ricin-type beta-trefoil lectin domain